MKIKTQVTLNDNLRAAFYFTYSRPLTIWALVLAVFFIVSFCINGIDWETNGIRAFFLLFLTLYILCIPLFLYLNTKRHYKSNKKLQKEITYEFTYETIDLKGEGFTSSFQWKDAYLVRESKNLFYIYSSKSIANILPKRYFSTEEMQEFRNLVKQSGVKSKLKKKY